MNLLEFLFQKRFPQQQQQQYQQQQYQKKAQEGEYNHIACIFTGKAS